MVTRAVQAMLVVVCRQNLMFLEGKRYVHATNDIEKCGYCAPPRSRSMVAWLTVRGIGIYNSSVFYARPTTGAYPFCALPHCGRVRAGASREARGGLAANRR